MLSLHVAALNWHRIKCPMRHRSWPYSELEVFSTVRSL